MLSSHSKLLVFSAFLPFLLSVPILLVNASGEEAATLVLNEAEETLASVYEAVLEAEQVGANVSVLLDQLNIGCEYLSRARIWDRLGNAENSSYFLGLLYNIAENVHSDALVLMYEAKRLAEDGFVVAAVGSVVAICVVLVSSFVVWRVFKRRFYRRVVGLNQGGSCQ